MVLSYFSAVKDVGLKRTTMLMGRSSTLGSDLPYRYLLAGCPAYVCDISPGGQ
jgi:hypothetical protein